MSAIKREVKPEKLGETLSEVISSWADEQEKEFVKAIDEAIDACDKKARQSLSKGHGVRTGTYRDHFAVDSGYKNRHHYSARWHVKAPHYRLTHLLEYGHAIRDGTGRKVGQSPAIKHVEYGREIAEQVLDEKLEKIWRN